MVMTDGAATALGYPARSPAVLVDSASGRRPGHGAGGFLSGTRSGPRRSSPTCLGAGIVLALLRPSRHSEDTVGAGLALMWMWTGLAYHASFFAARAAGGTWASAQAAAGSSVPLVADRRQRRLPAQRAAGLATADRLHAGDTLALAASVGAGSAVLRLTEPVRADTGGNRSQCRCP